MESTRGAASREIDSEPRRCEIRPLCRVDVGTSLLFVVDGRTQDMAYLDSNELDGIAAVPYIGAAMRFYYRAYGFTYRYSFAGERAGETCAAGASKTS